MRRICAETSAIAPAGRPRLLRSRRARVTTIAASFVGAAVFLLVLAAFVSLRSTISGTRFYIGLSVEISSITLVLLMRPSTLRAGTIHMWDDRLVYHSLFGKATFAKTTTMPSWSPSTTQRCSSDASLSGGHRLLQGGGHSCRPGTTPLAPVPENVDYRFR